MREAASDIVIVGGGPAGAAAGIAALDRGLRVVLFEASAEPRDRPGETLHPGAAPILEKLGVLAGIELTAACRPNGQWVSWGGPPELQRYGSGDHGDWKALQVSRHSLDSLLLDRFRALGGELVRPAPSLAPIVEGGRIAGVVADAEPVRSSITIDASGTRGFLRRALGFGMKPISPTLVAHYGYRKGVFGDHPVLEGDRRGWTWTAQVEADLVAWVGLSFDPKSRPRPLPQALAHMPDAGRGGAADVTWRLADRMAGPGWFVAGEAAGVLDPAASHGILRALMSGMMAAHSAAVLIAGSNSEERVERAYGAWLQSWFQHDVAGLLTLYRRLGVDWSGRYAARHAARYEPNSLSR